MDFLVGSTGELVIRLVVLALQVAAGLGVLYLAVRVVKRAWTKP